MHFKMKTQSQEECLWLVGIVDWLSARTLQFLCAPRVGLWMHHSVFLLENDVVNLYQSNYRHRVCQ